jgi:hypothetical protein
MCKTIQLTGIGTFIIIIIIIMLMELHMCEWQSGKTPLHLAASWRVDAAQIRVLLDRMISESPHSINDMDKVTTNYVFFSALLCSVLIVPSS